MAIFNDSFETSPDGFSPWTSHTHDGSSSNSIDTSNPYPTISGNNNNATFTIVGSGGYSQADKTSLTSGSDYYLRAYYKLASGLPASDGDMMTMQGAMSNTYEYGAFCEIKRVSGQLYWGICHFENSVEQDTFESTPSNPTTGQWYCIEIERDVSGGLIRLWVDEVLKVSVSRSISGNNNLAEVGCGYKNFSGSTTMYVDSVVVDSAYIGPISGDPTQGSTTIQGDLIVTGMAEIDGMTTLKYDIGCYGFYGTSSDPDKGTGGGAILMGHGFTSPTDNPQIGLTDTVANIGGQNAAATLTVNSNGTITAVPVTNQGSDYYFADVDIQKPTNGSGARLAPVINGPITGVAIVNGYGGAHYSSTDILKIIGDGSGAAATFTLNANGTITGVTVTSQGDNYSLTKTGVEITKLDGTASNGAGAQLIPIINGKIKSIKVYAGGAGYSSSDVITITNTPHDTLYLQKTANAQGGISPANLNLGSMTFTNSIQGLSANGYSWHVGMGTLKQLLHLWGFTDR